MSTEKIVGQLHNRTVIYGESIEEMIRECQQEALTARARGDWEAERKALDAVILLERLSADRESQ